MSNQLKIKLVNEKVVMPDSFNGPDTNNILMSTSDLPIASDNKSYPSGTPYEVTQDCWCLIKNTANTFRRIFINPTFTNGVVDASSVSFGAMGTAGSDDPTGSRILIPLKAGDRIAKSRYGGESIVLFGIKY